MARLGDLSEIGAGNSAPQAQQSFVNGTYPFFRTSDVGRVHYGTIVDSTDHLNEVGIKRLRRFPKGTILFPKSGASTFLNHRVMLGVDGYVSSHLATIIADANQVDQGFLLHFLSTVAAQELIQDHAYPSLTLATIGAIEVVVPPLPEQQRIVSILDEAFESIATAKSSARRNLQNASALLASRLQMAFAERGHDWAEKRLSEVSRDFGRGKSKHRPRNDPQLYDGEYPFIQTGDVRNSVHRITSYSQTYNEVGLAQSKLWPAGTLCITIAANIAETGILDFAACFPDSVIGVVVDDAVANNRFLEYLLQSFKARLQAQGKGSAQDNINLATFENLTFPFPSVQNQESIVSMLDSLREETQRLASLYQRKLSDLDELRQSLLHQAFTGQL